MMLQGCDVSHYDGEPDFAAYYDSGGKFVWQKATQGVGGRDPTLGRNVKSGRAAGLYVGVYHVWVPGDDIDCQAHNFFGALSDAGVDRVGMLVPALDIEQELAEQTSPDILVADMLGLIAFVERVTGRGCVIYACRSTIEQIGQAANGDALGAYPLWIAEYGVEQPTIPAVWSEWAFWQTAETGLAQGGFVNDLDVFAGEVADIEKLVVR